MLEPLPGGEAVTGPVTAMAAEADRHRVGLKALLARLEDDGITHVIVLRLHSRTLAQASA